ncbi:hypothetical protein C1I99_27400, partial [Micromonospora deserti]
ASGYLGAEVCRQAVAAGRRVVGTYHSGLVAVPGVEARRVDVTDLAAAVLELVESDHAGPLNVAGPDAVSRVELGLLVARRHGLDPAGMKTTTSASSGLLRPAEVRLDSSRAAALLRTRLRGVREPLAA